MDIKDQFTMAAMQAFILAGEDISFKSTIQAAFDVAEDMMEEREARKNKEDQEKQRVQEKNMEAEQRAADSEFDREWKKKTEREFLDYMVDNGYTRSPPDISLWDQEVLFKIIQKWEARGLIKINRPDLKMLGTFIVIGNLKQYRENII